MWINKIIYLAVLVYAGVLSLLYTNVQSLYVFLLLLSAGIVQILVVTYMKRRISAKVVMDTLTVNKDEPMKASLVLENEGIFPISCVKVIVSYENAYEHLKQYQSFLVSMNGKTTQSIHFTLTSEHVGSIEIGIKKIIIYDLLRIFHRNIKEDSKGIIKVFPEIFIMENEVNIRHQELMESDVFSKVKSGDDPSEVFDIREYKDGDKIHRIHWKLSRKRDCIMVKEYSLPIACSAGILVNLGVPSGEEGKMVGYDVLMATVASISFHMISNEQIHYIAWYEEEKEGYHCETVQQEEDLYRVLHGLLEAREVTSENDIVTVHKMLGEHPAVAKLYYITGNRLEKEEQIFATEYAGTEVQAICIEGGSQMEEEDAVSPLSGGICHVWTKEYKACIEELLL